MIHLEIPYLSQVISCDLGANCDCTEFAKLNGVGKTNGFVVYDDLNPNNPNHVGCIPSERKIINVNDEDNTLGVRLAICVSQALPDSMTEEENERLLEYLYQCSALNKSIKLGKIETSLRDDVENPRAQIKNGLMGRQNFKELYKKEPIEWVYYPKLGMLFTKNIIMPAEMIYANNVDIDSDIIQSINEDFEELLEYNKCDLLYDYSYDTVNGSPLYQNLRLQKPSFEKPTAIDGLEDCLKANMPVFLHGKPGEGKSQRVKDIDPDCVTLELELLPIEELSGIEIFDGKKVKKLKPDWFKKFEKLCASDPDKTHILFLEELTNAPLGIQKLAYSLVLDRKVGGVWKLPDNARIVAAGNEVEDSISATEMPLPLKDRFAHIHVDTALEEWLEWAQKHNIHEAIIAYLTYRGKGALRATGEIYKSEGETIKFSITPRTWELASKQLYATQDVRDLRSKIGDPMLKDFIAFCKIKIIKIEEILSGEVDSDIFFNKNIVTKMAMVRGLTNATEEEYEQVREFVKNAGREVLALFDSLWMSKDKKGSTSRAEKVAEMRAKDRESLNVGVDFGA